MRVDWSVYVKNSGNLFMERTFSSAAYRKLRKEALIPSTYSIFPELLSCAYFTCFKRGWARLPGFQTPTIYKHSTGACSGQTNSSEDIADWTVRGAASRRLLVSDYLADDRVCIDC